MRYLQNNSSNASPQNCYVAFHLQGTTVNRDAIGARVELTTSLNGKPNKSMLTLRAGEGYLSQSSKWLHFGLGSSKPVSAVVRWPNGDEQSISGLESNKRYRWTQDMGVEHLATSTRDVALPNRQEPASTADASIRIVPARPIPAPTLQLFDDNGQPFLLDHRDGASRLLTVWATWCQPCATELQELQKESKSLAALGIQWLPINVDDFDQTDINQRVQKARAFVSKLGVKTRTTIASSSAVDCLDAIQRVLTARKSNLPVPCNFLLNKEGEVLAVYKGAASSKQIARDWQQFQKRASDPRDHAIPFPGTWSMNSFPPDLIAIPNRLADIGRSLEAFEYLAQHVPTDTFEPPITRESLGATYAALGREFARKQQLSNAELALKYALRINAVDVQSRLGLADVLLGQKRPADAVRQYQEILKVAENQPMTLNNLAWILATSRDETIRDAKQAIAYATKLQALTGGQEPVSLGTYAVALAADGQFEKAIASIQQAIALSKQAGKPVDRLEQRHELFRQRRPYVE